MAHIRAKLDFPGVSCESCKEALVIDGKEPPCWNEVGAGLKPAPTPGVDSCWLPPLDEAGQRILEIRGKLIALRDLVDPGMVLKMYGVTLEEIEILAAVEEELRKVGAGLKPAPTGG